MNFALDTNRESKLKQKCEGKGALVIIFKIILNTDFAIILLPLKTHQISLRRKVTCMESPCFQLLHSPVTKK